MYIYIFIYIYLEHLCEHCHRQETMTAAQEAKAKKTKDVQDTKVCYFVAKLFCYICSFIWLICILRVEIRFCNTSRCNLIK
jgi:hypothetical protein